MGAHDGEDGDRLVEDFPAIEVPGSGLLHVSLHTSEGAIVLRLEEERAPRTVRNFVGLATGAIAWRDPKTKEEREGVPFYDGLCFHRVVRNFVVQCGDPGTRHPDLRDRWGRGTPGYVFEDEFHPELRHNRPGVVSMANRGKDTNGSQFFITEVPAPHLDQRHTAFGCVITGREVVRTIADADTDEAGRPRTPVVLERVELFRQ